ncbi:MAG: DNA ligase D [Gemmatimonadetes bacterium]|nr:DNA ligase D [Gemmatimonadota bacterium]MDA1102754.1 DNA ligase D [Gemmatimonadota bacterium]
MTPTRDERLTTYRDKRSASRTPEPFGGRVVAGGSIFVVQKHAARNLHWDLRLELDGVLLSWAIPKGPSPNQADKRLAMQTEDHPLEYAEFEGVIPAGEYGAGAMIVWDRGVWVPLEDAHEGLEKGKLLFELRGHKLLGKWTLVKTKQAPNSWLLIKERDAYLDPTASTEDYPDDSIYSGLTVEEFPDADAHAEEIAARVRELGAKERVVRAADVNLMLASSEERPFTRDGWIFEIKYDGYRLLAERSQREPMLRSRAGHDMTVTFPEIARAVRGLPFDDLVLDGEVVVLDGTGRPSFSRLQRRGRILNPADALRSSVELPAIFQAFDLLGIEGHDLRALPLLERKDILRRVLPSVGPIRYTDHIPEQGEAMYAQVERMRLEGIVAKKADGPYRGGRSKSWIKVRTVTIDDFAVVGWTEPKGSRGGFGSLHIAQYDDEDLVYLGSVGSGFRDSELDELLGLLEELEVETCPCSAGPVPKGKGHHWVRPELVAEVKYKELTDHGLARQPSFSRFRTDKSASECRVEGEPVEEAAEATVAEVVEERTVAFSNLDKVFWPEEGYTKGDLIEYHRSVAEWMLPYLVDRPLVMTRFPDGIDGKSFFQKDAPPYAPDWFRTVTVWSEGSERELSYFVAEDLESLLYVINLGTIPLHVWSSRIATLAAPDWCILDLDPKEAPFTDVVEVALTIHALCEEIGLPSFPKTSGSSGIHVLIPLGRRLTYEQSRSLGQLLARVVVAELPEIATVTRNPDRREGKVYVDFVQNGHGRLLVAPFTVRPKPAAPVSAPLKWSEVNKRLKIENHTIKSMPRRMKRLGEDPLRPVLDLEPDLLSALERLTTWFD